MKSKWSHTRGFNERYTRWWMWGYPAKIKLAELIAEDPSITYKAVAEEMGCSVRTVQRRVRDLQDELMLPRSPKRTWTSEMINITLEATKKKTQLWASKLEFGYCPNCEDTGKDFCLKYRKLTEKGYWLVFYKCKKCGTPFGHHIEADVGTDFWREEQRRIVSMDLFGFEMEQNLAHARRIMKKLKKGEYVPPEEVAMVLGYLEKVTKGGRR